MAKSSKPTKAERLEARKEAQKKAAAAAAAAAAAERRRKTITTAGITVVLILLVAGITWALYSKKQTDQAAAPKGTEQTAYVFGAGQTELTIYEDFSCHACRAAENVIGQDLQQMAEDNEITLKYEIISFLGPGSTRAANAAGCAADQGKFLAFHNALYSPQLEPYTFEESALLQTGSSLGLTDPYAKCVSDGKYLNFVTKATENAQKAQIEGTPTFVLNGEVIQPDSESFTSILRQVKAAVKKAENTPGQTPNKTAEPTPSTSN